MLQRWLPLKAEGCGGEGTVPAQLGTGRPTLWPVHRVLGRKGGWGPSEGGGWQCFAHAEAAAELPSCAVCCGAGAVLVWGLGDMGPRGPGCSRQSRGWGCWQGRCEGSEPPRPAR